MSSWSTPPYAAPGAPYAPPQPPPDSGYALRPMSMGEVLDRTFAVYRRNFWLIAGISAISGAVQLLSSSTQMAVNHILLRHHDPRPMVAVISGIVGFVGTCLFYLAAAFTQAATVYALSEVYLGRTTTVKESLQGVRDGWWKYPLIGIWQFFSGAWPAMLMFIPAIALGYFMRGQMVALIALLVVAGFAALAGGVVLYLRNSLGIAVQVVERPGIRASMRRSKTLTQGAKGTVFVLYLIVGVLYYASGILIVAVLGIIVFTHRGSIKSSPEEMLTGMMTGMQAVSMIISFFMHVVILPIVLVGTAIVYFNQRVKQEGFDLLVMLGGGEAAAAATSSDLGMAYPPVYPPVAAVYPPVTPGYGVAPEAAVYPPVAPAYPPEPPVAYPPAAPVGFETPVEGMVEGVEPAGASEPETPGPSDETTL